MSTLTITFAQEWVSEHNKSGNRIIRILERWIATIDSVMLKSSTANGLTVEMLPAARESFLKELAEKLKNDFQETDLWQHAMLSGDLDGLDVPISSQIAHESADSKIKQSVEDKTIDNKQNDVLPDKQETLDDICNRVPIKYSRELEAYVRETAEVIPMLQKMGAESSLWHQHLLLAIDAGFGRSEFLGALVQLYQMKKLFIKMMKVLSII